MDKKKVKTLNKNIEICRESSVCSSIESPARRVKSNNDLETLPARKSTATNEDLKILYFFHQIIISSASENSKKNSATACVLG